jgi:amino acid transporter
MTDHTVQDPGKLARSGQTIADQSAVLGKELGLRDLVLTRVLVVVGLGWIGTAAKVGPSHIVFWLLAISLFYLPCAAVVIYLTRLMPLEGGLYQWAKLGFNDFVGFLVAWNLWLYVIVNSSEVGLQVSTYNSILFVGAVTLAVGVASVAGVGEQEAYQRSASAP